MAEIFASQKINKHACSMMGH